jgi:hypothetical protein
MQLLLLLLLLLWPQQVVLNFDAPRMLETYLHCIHRTARAASNVLRSIHPHDELTYRCCCCCCFAQQVVLNFDAPRTLETYLHRIGRTARAGESGVAVSLIGDEDRVLLKEVVKKGRVMLKQRVVPPQVRIDADAGRYKPWLVCCCVTSTCLLLSLAALMEHKVVPIYRLCFIIMAFTAGCVQVAGLHSACRAICGCDMTAMLSILPYCLLVGLPDVHRPWPSGRARLTLLSLMWSMQQLLVYETKCDALLHNFLLLWRLLQAMAKWQGTIEAAEPDVVRMMTVSLCCHAAMQLTMLPPHCTVCP